ncbi:P-loop containing nucleoside triphosphate hydrolase protein [Daedaleopsis nitida]|nr:P-loop containing nucleoside triphosphate hydrolase protein [Daedaleopsis nitida]
MISSTSSTESNAHIGDTGYARTARGLNALVSKLRGFGAQIDLDLPRIVVIGNQSVGKSSLVEAISGINVPRDTGTCTRCPMECRLSNSELWSCQISIRWEYDEDDLRLAEVHEERFGSTLCDPSEVEDMLRRAQAAILSPRTPRSDFLDADIDTVKSGGVSTLGAGTLPFSRNIICVDLAGQELVDLSFVDLPGIVQNEEPEYVRLVEELVTSYVGGNSLILVLVPISDDMENQKAARIAKEADPLGLRTIGVMTKPDMLLSGSTKRRDMWLDVIEGRQYVLKHGYYCTRQPDDDERMLGITLAEARVAEAKFFKSTAPWSTSSALSRFGTTNLVKNISVLLTEIITDSLPNLLEEVSKQLAACKKQLDALPPVITTDPSTFVFNLVVNLCAEIRQHVDGSPTHTQLVQANKATYHKLKTHIISTAPVFVPFEDDDGSDRNADFLKLDDELDDEVEAKAVTKRIMYLREVRDRIRACVTRELPNNIPYAAKRTFIRDFQESWERHTMTCFSRVQETFTNALMEIIQLRFSRFGSLKSIIAPIVMEQLQLCSDDAIDHAQTILKLEYAAPFTLNTQSLAEKRDKLLAKYKGARPQSASSGLRPLCPDNSKLLSDALAALTRLGLSVKEEDLGKLSPPDDFEEELMVMAEVRAYFQIAYRAVLFEKLGLGSPGADERCAAYVTEDPGVVAARSEVLAKQKRLDEVQKELFNFGL